MIVDKKVESGNIPESILNFKEELVENLQLFSVFEGDPISAGKKSISYRITYRSPKETLQDEVVNIIHKDITDRLVKAYDATLPV